MNIIKNNKKISLYSLFLFNKIKPKKKYYNDDEYIENRKSSKNKEKGL